MKSINKNKIIVYTAIFGSRDVLNDPIFIPEGCDFICFTDQPFSSKIWTIQRTAPFYKDNPNKSAKLYKIFPHRFLWGYDTSIWIDGNILVRGNVKDLEKKYLSENKFAAYNHALSHDKRSSIYEEAEAILEAMNRGRYIHLDSSIIRKQMDTYRSDGYKGDGGLITAMIMFRRHKEPDVINTMNAWWKEIEKYTVRDQLSFNYVAWKTNLSFSYIEGDSRDNKYFTQVPHAMSTRKKIIRKIRNLLQKISSQ